MFKAKIFLRRISFLVIVGVFCLGKPGFCANAALKFSLILDKAQYSADEPINITFSLRNLGSSPVMVNQRFYISDQKAAKNQKEVYFELTSPTGAKLACQHFYETGYPKTEYFKLLGTGEEAKSDYPRNLKGLFDIVEPGTYTLVAVYQNVFGAELGLDTFKEQLVSEPVKFTIVNTKNK
jgi:hypothetical protein